MTKDKTSTIICEVFSSKYQQKIYKIDKNNQKILLDSFFNLSEMKYRLLFYCQNYNYNKIIFVGDLSKAVMEKTKNCFQEYNLKVEMEFKG